MPTNFQHDAASGQRAPSLPLAPSLRAADEFPAGASEWPSDLSRRDFVQLLGASLALAGLAGCGRPLDKLVPYVNPPEKTPSPDVAWYATAMPWCGFARGVLAKAVQGRPIKLEGNPDHPESRGATDAVTQAAILSLYDPDRSPAPLRAGHVATWDAFESEWTARLPDLRQRRGAGLALLTEPTTSPTELRLIHALLAAWPEAQWFQHTPLARFDRDGAQADFDFATADVILSIGSDCFYQHPAALRYVRDFATRRRVENGRVNLNRFFALEATPSLTGMQADARLAVAPARMTLVLNALARAIDGGDVVSSALSSAERDWLRDCAAQLRDPAKTAVCVVGEEMPAEYQRWSDAFNHRFARGAARRLHAVRSDSDVRAHGGLAECVAAMASGGISALCVLGANPIYTAPGGLDVMGALRRVAFTVHLGAHVDETAAQCAWHLPESHFLETWSDLRAVSGVASLQQPLLEPLHASCGAAELLQFLGQGAKRSAYDLVRETWQTGSSADFETRWHDWLNRGVIDERKKMDGQSAALAEAVSPAFPTLTEVNSDGEVTVLFRPDANVLDGRWANNAWLQELPRPFTSLVWENAALIDAGLAARLGLVNGDIVTCEIGGTAVAAPVWILPGQAANCVTLPLGYGRTRGGGVAEGRGFSAYPLRRAEEPWQRAPATIKRTPQHRELVGTQGHFAMEGRDLVHVAAAADIARAPQEESEVKIFPEWPREGYAWGMSIDLSTCYGCNACVIACQAENNIPVVGRDQVARGREMHWIRVDRYFSGDPANPRVLHQPVPCMHCEHAPCEVVCPVAATVHTSEGLNDMVYNRCVGTRYCSNNCPYKVRRFNFLDYRAPRGSPVYLQSNPDVTVRSRGVMEKCTYCVQRINAGRIAAEKQDRRIRDGEVRTACQQACPVEAIVFGDINDPSSRVTQCKREKISYALLGELNTKPRTTYLARVMPDAAVAREAHKS